MEFITKSNSGKTIYLVRHGLPEFPDDRKRLPLSKIGENQAKLLAENLREIELTDIYCSDLKRAYSTAKIIGMLHKIKPKALKELREINMGEWEGLTFDKVKITYPQQFKARGEDILNYRVQDGENFLEFSKRVIKVFKQLLEQSDKNLFIVSHAGVNRIIISYLIGLPLQNIFQLGQDYCCLNIIEYKKQRVELQLLNRTIYKK